MSEWPQGYACAPDLGESRDRWALRPVRWDDRQPIRAWRNSQIDVLRQTTPLTARDQDAYFRDVVRPQMDDRAPDQVLVAFTEDGQLIGYGGFVHVSWPDRRAELSFLTDPDRVERGLFAHDVRVFLPLLIASAERSLHLHKLTTETFAFRSDMLDLLTREGFVLEGTLRDQYASSGGWVDSHIHARLLGA